jgi:hypothetical protein
VDLHKECNAMPWIMAMKFQNESGEDLSHNRPTPRGTGVVVADVGLRYLRPKAVYNGVIHGKRSSLGIGGEKKIRASAGIQWAIPLK